MNSNESFKANGKIYITPAGVEKIKNSLRKDKRVLFCYFRVN